MLHALEGFKNKYSDSILHCDLIFPCLVYVCRHLMMIEADWQRWRKRSKPCTVLAMVNTFSLSPHTWRAQLSLVDVHTVAQNQCMGKKLDNRHFFVMALGYVQVWTVIQCPGHDAKLHPHRVKLYRIGGVLFDLVLVKALMQYLSKHALKLDNLKGGTRVHKTSGNLTQWKKECMSVKVC